MHLSDLLGRNVPSSNLSHTPLTHVTDDTRALTPESVFVFDVRNHPQGGKWVEEALQRGVTVISNVEKEGVLFHPFPGEVLARWAKAQHLKSPECMVAVTGTNGKTSTAWFYQDLMQRVTGQKAASIGTLGVTVEGKVQEETGYTSPTALVLHPLLENLANQGVRYTCMEAASIALELRRLEGVRFQAAALTNITQDHLDFHGTMEAYSLAKLRLFTDLLTEDGLAVLPIARPEALVFAAAVKEAGCRVLTVGSAQAELVVAPEEVRADGLTVLIKYEHVKERVNLPLIGAFQAENVATALGLMVGSGVALEDVIPHLEEISCVPGRMELVPSFENQPTVIVDYAHTPDALARVLQELKPLVKGKLWTVFGCGGDRDKTKRPLMGAAVARYADEAVVTDDNPRGEDAATIRAETLAGMTDMKNVINQEGRREAMAYALQHAKADDVVLIAGKGHESGQTVQGVTHPFDDRLVAAEILKEMA